MNTATEITILEGFSVTLQQKMSMTIHNNDNDDDDDDDDDNDEAIDCKPRGRTLSRGGGEETTLS